MAGGPLRAVAIRLPGIERGVKLATCAVLERGQRRCGVNGPLSVARLAQARHTPREPRKQVSHETIYRSLFIQARGVLKKELLEHLRARRTVRRSRHASMKRNGLGQIKNAVSISERPPSVEDRAVPGHWEGDLIGGSGNSYVATLVERHFALRDAGQGCEQGYRKRCLGTDQAIAAIAQRTLPVADLDRGKELADHQRLTLATEVEVYFCDPRSPWQRGSNENTNRLLRQYLPRGTDLSLHSQARLSAIARQLNERPRKTLLYQTPAREVRRMCCSDRLNSPSFASILTCPPYVRVGRSRRLGRRPATSSNSVPSSSKTPPSTRSRFALLMRGLSASREDLRCFRPRC